MRLVKCHLKVLEFATLYLTISASALDSVINVHPPFGVMDLCDYAFILLAFVFDFELDVGTLRDFWYYVRSCSFDMLGSHFRQIVLPVLYDQPLLTALVLDVDDLSEKPSFERVRVNVHLRADVPFLSRA